MQHYSNIKLMVGSNAATAHYLAPYLALSRVVLAAGSNYGQIFISITFNSSSIIYFKYGFVSMENFETIFIFEFNVLVDPEFILTPSK